ncbi:MAG: YkgJ family cysteine cluster protein [Actinomycetota bacterium]|nr:YkgJ family cysteine cluster protein [Actinomycetota bacterium]
MPAHRAETLAAGDFATWLGSIGQALRDGTDSAVPCGACTACCSAGMFIHVGPDEAAARAAIPADLLVPAPGLPDGHSVMGHDRDGRCPMLVDGSCSIYDHRPQACRTYDCRVFTATGVVDADPARAGVMERASRWRFDYADAAAREQQASLLAAAATGQEPNPLGRALTAIAMSKTRG